MSLSRERLKQFLLEDAVANKCNKSFFVLFLSFIRYRPEKILVYRYLWHLRHTEYYQGQKSIFGKTMHIWHKRKCSRLGSRYMIFIPPNKSGFGLRINHLSGGGGCYLNVKQIGNHCSFNAGVLVGETGKGLVPSIGNNVVFGTGSKAYGEIVIGDNVIVAPNAVVTHDVPSNCVVAGVPARIIKQLDHNI